ncbi:MAG: single-stranded-DNA-specific exonuclease RecJ [Deltaproteobacteria bacterium]|nr:single-stranded-DNA-specific exonuclease RecJ [Deltaproteobacteria bacterium]MBW2343800.1 single-stranded-DNA-specific exonuclease RecJ [Deltaproteobacteria bacterium]
MVPPNTVWKLTPPSPSASRLALEAGVTPLQAQLLINRGISNPSQAKSFLCPRLADMANPMLLKDMDCALAMILKAVEDRKKITIYGDYDADGLTATALLLNFFSCLGIETSSYIPNRLTEGYGLNKEAVETIAADGTDLIITVDCGISNSKEIAFAKNLGMNVVVTDHHQVPQGFSAGYPIINPHRADCLFPFKDLAGVGIAFFLAIAIRTALRKKGWFETKTEPDLREYLDLVALGTVADRVPLLDQNRMLVSSGLGIMGKSRWKGIKAMIEVAGIGAPDITADDLAFRLGPRLNAPGRMDDPGLCVKILTTDDTLLAKDLALRINDANIKRQGVERHILDKIEAKIKKTEGIDDRRALVMAGEGWHKGVLGIVASRLVDKYNRPVLVLDVQDGMAAGSGRSIDGFNLYEALSRLGYLFEKFGGHAHAAGFTLKAANLETLRMELEGVAEKNLRQEDMVPAIHMEAEVSLDHITFDMVRQVRALGPFGEGNPEPVFLARPLEVAGSRVVGERHLKLRVSQGGTTLEAIGFGLADKHPLEGKTISMVFTPELNYWQGYERIQLRIIDLILENSGGKLDVFGTENK